MENIFFLKPSPARGEREQLWAGTGALWLQPCPSHAPPTEQVPSKALGTFYNLKTIYLIDFLLKIKISPPI